MPHVAVKMYPGRTEEQKKALTEEITRVVMTVLKSAESSVSVSIEDIQPEDWDAKVFQPDVKAKDAFMYKRAG